MNIFFHHLIRQERFLINHLFLFTHLIVHPLLPIFEVLHLPVQLLSILQRLQLPAELPLLVLLIHCVNASLHCIPIRNFIFLCNLSFQKALVHLESPALIHLLLFDFHHLSPGLLF